MKRTAKWVVTAAVLVCSVAGAGQQKRRGATPNSKARAEGKQSTAPSSNPFIDAIRDNNLGIAYMERMDFENALGQFQVACVLDPQTDAGCVNMGIALLQLKRYEQAQTIFEKAAERDAANPRAWFNLGLIARVGGQPATALQDFEKVRALDPADPAVPYFVAVTDAETGKDPEAIPNFQSAINMDPWNASAELGLAQALERHGETDAALMHLGRFRHLIAGDLGYSVTGDYGTQGKYSLAEEITAGPGQVAPAEGVHFVNMTAASGLPVQFAEGSKPSTRQGTRPTARNGQRGIRGSSRGAVPAGTQADESLSKFLGSGACVFDFDGDGKPDILLVNGDGKGAAALYRNTGGGKFDNVTKSAGIVFRGRGTGCAAGDINNDGRMDFAISSSEGVRLYENQGNGKFKDVTEAEGIQIEGLVLGLTFVDYDHDGFLDLYVTRFTDLPVRDTRGPFVFTRDQPTPGNLLLRNTGHGKFVDVTVEMQARGEVASVGALPTDANNDGLTDLLVTGTGEAPTLLVGQNEGAYATANIWIGDQPGATAGAAALDVDEDGWTDYAFTHWSNAGVSLWRNVRGLYFEKMALPNLGWMRGWGIAAVDYDNDGWVDLFAAGETFSGEARLLLLRNEGAAGFRDVTHEAGLDKIKVRDPRSVIAADFEGNGSLDLLITQNTGAPVLLKTVGAGGNGWIDLGLKGTRDNRPGLGASATMLAGDLREKVELSGSAGYLGSGPMTIHAGLGNFAQADVLRVVWPNGKKQIEMQVRGEKRMVIEESVAPKANVPGTFGTDKQP